jgi:hypothetical protein
MQPVTKKKKKEVRKTDATSHSTFLTTLASPIILGCDNFFENRKNWKEEDETEVATDPQPKIYDNNFILNLKAMTNKIKKHNIVDIPSEDTHWPKKTIRSKTEETRSTN